MFDLQKNQLKWDGIIAPLVPKVFWSQHRINDFWRDVSEDVIDIGGCPKGSLFNQFIAVLEASEHEKVDVKNVSSEENASIKIQKRKIIHMLS